MYEKTELQVKFNIYEYEEAIKSVYTYHACAYIWYIKQPICRISKWFEKKLYRVHHLYVVKENVE